MTLINNPELYTWQADPPDYRKYGIEVRLPEAAVEGAAVVLTFRVGASSVDVENYYLPGEAYAAGLRAAGFRDVCFHGLKLGPDPRAGDEGDYWKDFFRRPLGVMIDGIKE